MKPLRIVVTADPYIPVPPVLYGGIERIVDIVVRGLADRGHDVTLIAHPDSTVPVPLIPYGSPPHFTRRARAAELLQVGRALWRRRHDTDVILSWGRLAALAPLLPLKSIAKLQRYDRDMVPWRGVQRAARIAGRSLTFAGGSSSVYDELPSTRGRGGRWITLYNGVDSTRYAFSPSLPAGAPLMFLGRFEPRKGADRAISIARRADRELILAGTIDDSPGGLEYFERAIEPHLRDPHVRYVGPADDRMKSDLLSSAAALLFPTTGKEAFGIVMAEAMACGTPVIAYPTGSVPEIVRPGVNGVIVHSIDEAVAAVSVAAALDRSAVRADCVARFDMQRTVDAFEAALYDCVARL
jgi:glycosyltransferase involved in cell wall biosynthesis